MNFTLTELYGKFKALAMKVIGKIHFPGLIAFIYDPKAKDPYNPTLEEVKASSLDPKTNWARMGWDKLTSFGMPIWLMFFAIISGIALIIGGEALINVLTAIIRFASNFYLLGILGVILYMIWKTFTKK